MTYPRTTRTIPRVPVVVTLLTAAERATVSAAAEGAFTPLHRRTMAEAFNDLRIGDVAGLVISVAGFDTTERDLLGTITARHPALPVIGLVCEAASESYNRAAQLGAAGARRVVDVGENESRAFRVLRSTFAPDPDQQYARTARETILRTLDTAGVEPTNGIRMFFSTIFADAQPVTVKQFAREIGMIPSTLMSRFWRERLPSPKRYLVNAVLVRFAKLSENRMLSISAIADILGTSSPQSFNRFVSSHTGKTAQQFRDSETAAGKFAEFMAIGVEPYLERWASGADPFAPFGHAGVGTSPRLLSSRYAAATP